MGPLVRTAEQPRLTASVAICTRNRTAGIDDVVRSALDTTGDSPVYVIDQNSDGLIDHLLAPYLMNPRLHHVKTTTIGVGPARNLALETAKTDIVCFTDDDCVVPANFVSRMVTPFRDRSDTALVYCAVRASANATNGYTPVHEPRRASVHARWNHSTQMHRLGLGAGMAVRVEPLRSIGGFDPMMGPGRTFPSADDREIAVRLLLAGHCVAHATEPIVIHHGFREQGTEARQLTRRDHTGIGALFSKMLRVRPGLTTVQFSAFLLHCLVDAGRVSIRLRRPGGLGKLVWTVVGFIQGLRTPIDKKSITFLDSTVPSAPLER